MSNVVITGSTKGVGRGLANEFIRRGHNVTISSRRQEDIDSVSAEINASAPGQCTGSVCDVTRKDDVQSLWDHAVAAFGKVDIWINNAGRAIGRHEVHELGEDDVATMVDSNLKGAIYGSQVAISGFRAQNGGALYNVLGGSYDGKMLTPQMGVYSATKSAIWRMTQYLIKENKNKNIVIGTISPGMLITENWFNEQKQMGDEAWQNIKPTLDVLCDHVDSSTPWLVERILENTKNGQRIVWLTNGKIMKRFFAAKLLGQKRNIFDRYGL